MGVGVGVSVGTGIGSRAEEDDGVTGEHVPKASWQPVPQYVALLPQ